MLSTREADWWRIQRRACPPSQHLLFYPLLRFLILPPPLHILSTSSLHGLSLSCFAYAWFRVLNFFYFLPSLPLFSSLFFSFFPILSICIGISYCFICNISLYC